MPHLITGRDKVNHVTSANDGQIHARMYGSGRYALHDAACSMETANTARVTGGLLLMDGRFIEIDGAGEEVAIANGSQGQKRNDLVGVRYMVDADGYESATFEAIKGTPTDGTPEDPPYDNEASILRGDADVFWPLFRVPLDGLSVGTPESLVGGWGLSIGSGGTGATTGKAACANLGAFAALAGSLKSTSPSELYNLAPGTYIVNQDGVYGNMIVSKVATDRTFAIVSFDTGESYILRGWTKGDHVASWDRIDNEISSLTAQCSTKTNLSASEKQIPIDRLQQSSGSALSLASNYIVCAKAGIVLVSGALYIKACGNCDNVQAGISGPGGNVQALSRNATITNGNDYSMVIPPKVIKVNAGDKIYWTCANWAGARGYVEGSSLSYINAVYLGGVR